MTEQVESIRRYSLPPKVGEWRKKIRGPFRWVNNERPDIDPMIAECLDVGCKTLNVHLESIPHGLGYEMTLGPINGTDILYVMDMKKDNTDLRGEVSVYKHCNHISCDKVIQNVVTIYGLLTLLQHILDNDIDWFKECDAEYIIQRIIVTLRVTIYRTQKKHNKILMLVNIIAVYVGQKYFRSIRLFTANLNDLAMSAKSCGMFRMAAELYINAYKLTFMDEREHLQSAKLALNAGIVCQDDRSYFLAEWAYVQHARHASLCNKEVDWSTILNLYTIWGCQTMAINLAIVLRTKNEYLLTKKMVSVQTCNDFRKMVRNFVKVVERQGKEPNIPGLGASPSSQKDGEDAIKQLSNAGPIHISHTQERKKNKYKSTSATDVSRTVNHDRETELERYHEREEKLRRQQREADDRRRTQVANERQRRTVIANAKVEERDAELAIRYNSNTSGKQRHKKTNANNDEIKEASIQAQKHHEFNLKLQEERRIAELERLASQIRIGHAIQCGQ
jgi:hypothetical protein